jgi:hypothetical protein
VSSIDCDGVDIVAATTIEGRAVFEENEAGTVWARGEDEAVTELVMLVPFAS